MAARTKFIVWVKEKGQDWAPNGEGPYTRTQADRIAGEIRKDCGVPTRVLAVGEQPAGWSDVRPPGPTLESPTWGHLHRMATVVIDKLGGPNRAAEGLSWESFYALTVLAALDLDEAKASAPIFGKRWLT